MIDLVVCLLLILGISACVAEVYFLVAYTHSNFGEYPPFFPSFGKMKKICLQKARKILQQADKPLKIVDLGCGSGSLIIPLAKEFPNHRFIGYDWDVIPYSIASLRARHISNIQLFCQDYTKLDYGDIDLILIFGGNKLFADWGDKFIAGLKGGTTIISEAFPIKQLKEAEAIDTPSYGMPLKVYIYKI